MNGRGIGITEFLQAYAEGPVVVLFALVTQLGDVWFLFLLGGALYIAGESLPRWGIDRRRGLFVFALALTYVALIGVLKNAFLLPRPPGAGTPPAVLWVPSVLSGPFTDITTAEGPGFPSGHALGTTMVWGGVALVLKREPSLARLGMAGSVVVLVGFSRLVLGVHYLVDVIVGAALGLVVLAVLYWLSDRGTDPGRILLLAVAIGIIGLFMGVTFDSVAALGGAVGGWIVWRGVAEVTPANPSRGREIAVGFAAFSVAAALFAAVYALHPSLIVAFLGAAVAAGGVVGAPVLGDRLA